MLNHLTYVGNVYVLGGTSSLDCILIKLIHRKNPSSGCAGSTSTNIMSYFLPHLPSGWHVDEAIKSEEDRVVVIRFGHDWDPQCMTMDETLYSVAEKVQNFAVIYLVDITAVPDFNKVCCV